jgi:phosphohistidine phosphatase
MRRLLLLRHSKAERAEPGISDPARELTAQGKADAATIGTFLASHSFRPDRVLVSPAIRTRDTWRQAAAAMRVAPEPEIEDRLYSAVPETLLTVVRATPDDVSTLLLLGHNPGLHEFATTLVASGDIETRERLREDLPTSGLAVLDFALDNWGKLHPRSGRLQRFVTPKLIAAVTN